MGKHSALHTNIANPPVEFLEKCMKVKREVNALPISMQCEREAKRATTQTWSSFCIRQLDSIA